ncbi:hypothetical protein [Streptomyces sp. PTD5-9]|uniref:hypothetical protein n=1 Tax=Streptomyces sp. PTD5-9 TaxID=3120150 RepID=UPI0030091D41
MTQSGRATHGQFSVLVALLVGIAHLVTGASARVPSALRPFPRPGRSLAAWPSALRI